jgi:hypothetical protein
LIFAPQSSNETPTDDRAHVVEAARNAVAAFSSADFQAPLEPGSELVITKEAADRDAGVAAFETMQALTELHFDVDQRFVREVGKRGVGLADLKRLALHLSKSVDFARAIYRLAYQAKLIAPVEGRWLARSHQRQLA